MSEGRPEGSEPRGRRAAVGFILVVILLDVLSSGIIIPSLAPLIQNMEGGEAAAAGIYLGVFAMTWAFAQFVGAPVLGALSDRFGRRPVIMGLAGVMGPLVFGHVWEVSPRGVGMPGSAFYLAAALQLAAVVLAFVLVARAPPIAGASA